MSISPPAVHFDLGDRIHYHHRACVARVPSQASGGTGIFATEPRLAAWCPIKQEGGTPPVDRYPFEEPNWLTRMPVRKQNKTILVWPEKGEGMIYGMIRRGIGTSHAGYTSGYEYPEWNPGYFEAVEWHWLYAVKTSLSGLTGIYVPLWAAQKR